MDANRTFRVGVLCGLVSVLVDFDHAIAWAIRYVSKGETIYSTRFLHTPVLIGSGIVFCCCCTYLGRQVCRYILNKHKDII